MIFRRLILAFLYALFSSALLFFALFLGLQQVLGTPTKLEKALAQSGIYDIAVTNTLAKDQQTVGKGGIPFSNPDVQAAVQKALPPSLLQHSTEQFLNGMYAWAQGTTPTPSFHIDLTGAKNNLADNVAAYMQNRLDSLPTCTSAAGANAATLDIYNATCLPPRFDKAAAVNQAKQDVLQSSFLSNPVLTADNVNAGNGQTLASRLHYVPMLHRDLLILLYALPFVIVLVVLGIIFVSRSRRAGIRHVGVTALTAGLLTVIVAFFAEYLLNHITNTLTKGGSVSQPLQVKALHVFNTLGGDLRNWWVGVGAAYAVLGLATLITLRATRPKAPQLANLPYQKLPDDTPIGATIAPTHNNEHSENPTTK